MVAMRSVWLPAAAIGIATLVTTGIFLLRRKSSEPYIEGAIYSVRAEQGFAVVKVLVIEPAAIHIRLYKNKFKQRPENIDVSTLTLGTIFDSDGFGIGHLPLSREDFAAWKPMFMHKSSLSKEELEGYEEWKRSQGGVWGKAN